jgi:glycine hydroxymethyltransferase
VPEQIYVNVQALSGGPANNAVYQALVKPGETVMGMNLFHGGHLSHGSPANRSGKYFNIVSYTVDPHNEQINYDDVMALALEHKPRMLICGYSSYPWIPDWKKFRQIADAAGAYLLADISHIGGLVAAGVVPSPVGYAHVITTTTYKTLMVRGMVITTDPTSQNWWIRRFQENRAGRMFTFCKALTFKLAQPESLKTSADLEDALAISNV